MCQHLRFNLIIVGKDLDYPPISHQNLAELSVPLNLSLMGRFTMQLEIFAIFHLSQTLLIIIRFEIFS